MPRWPQIRAGLIAAAIGFGLIEGCPLPSAGHVPGWERWLVEPVRVVRDVAVRPVAWLGRAAAVTQQWSLYQAPVADRYRMWIEGFAGGRWITLYLAGDPDHRAYAELIEHARVWGTWDPTSTPPLEYAAFAHWIVARVLADHPELAAARVQMEKVLIGQGEVTPTGEMLWPIFSRRVVAR